MAAVSYTSMLTWLMILAVCSINGDLLGEDGRPVGNHREPSDSRRPQDGVVRHGEWDSLLSESTDHHETYNQEGALLVNNCTLSGTNVTCEGDDVTEISADFPNNITLISFEATKVTEIPAGAFQNYQSLTTIQFRLNYLEAISKDAFRGLSNLKELTLRWNVLSDSTFVNEPYKGLSSLETLDICQNYRQLTQLPWGLLQGASNLKTLMAYFNNIKQLPSELTFNLTQLTHIELLGLGPRLYGLTSIDGALFNNIPNIEYLSVVQNSISTVQNGSAFMKRPRLKTLYLHTNPLVCDCRALWMLEARAAETPWAMNWTSLTSPSCGSPEWLPKVIDLYPADLTCERPEIEAITPTNLTHSEDTPLTLQARMKRGYPKSKWWLPNGKWTSGADSVNETDHSVVTTLVREDVGMTGPVNFTLVASNVMGETRLTYQVYIEPGAGGGAGGAPVIYTGTLLLMLMCTRIFTG